MSDKRIPFSKRLSDLGISDSDFELYMNLFVLVPGRVWLKKFRIFPWQHLKNIHAQKPIPLTKYHIAKHLQGEYWIARALPKYTDFFCIDLDCGISAASLRDLNERYDRVRKLLGNPVVFQSSESGGLHLYYWTDYGLKDFLGKVLNRFLSQNGLALKGGVIETFPGTIDHLRLPLGRDSHLLDPETLRPLGLPLKESLQYVKDNKVSSYISISKMDPHPLYEEENSRRLHQNKKTYHEIYKRLFRFRKHSVHIQQILQTRLKYGERHEKTKKLVAYFMLDLGFSDKDTLQQIWAYLDLPGHKSKDLEKSRTLVDQLTRGLIKNLRTKIDKGGVLFYRRKPLGKKDIEYILNMTRGFKKNNQYGHEAFTLQELMFGIFQFALSRGVDELVLSRTLLLRWSSQKRIANQMQNLVELGILTLVSEGDLLKHLARTYRLNYTLSNEQEYDSLETALRSMFTKSELYKMYSTGIYRKLVRNWC